MAAIVGPLLATLFAGAICAFGVWCIAAPVRAFDFYEKYLYSWKIFGDLGPSDDPWNKFFMRVAGTIAFAFGGLVIIAVYVGN